MIARVAVKHKINSDIVFDYKIDKDQKVPLYSIIRVNFAGKKILGIVLGFKAHSSKPCKAIEKTVSTQPFITKQQVELARAIASYFISPFGPTLLSLLPNLPQREIAKIEESSSMLRNRKSISELVLSSSDQRLQYYLQKVYVNKQNLLILPLLSQIAEASRKIKRIYPSIQVFTWHSKLTAMQKRIIWQKCLSGENMVVIGSRDALFLPFRKLGCIFIDNPNSFSYFEDQLPRYNAFFVARFLQKQFNADLFVGETFPSITSYVAYRKNVLRLKEIGKRSNHFKIYDGFYQEIKNPTIINRLAGTLQKAKKIAVIWPFKENKKIICRNCNIQINCPFCKNEYYTPDFRCSQCNKKAPSFCPKCKSQNLATVGHSKSSILDSFKSVDKNKFFFLDLDKISTLPPTFDQALIPFFDNMVDFPFVSYKEKVATGIWQILEKVSGNIHIFTYKYKDLTSQISNFKWDDFIKNQLIERKKENLPPYVKAVKIVSKYNKVKSQTIVDDICSKLKAKNPILLSQKDDKIEFLLFFDHIRYKQVKSELRQKLDGKLYFVVDPIDFSL